MENGNFQDLSHGIMILNLQTSSSRSRIDTNEANMSGVAKRFLLAVQIQNIKSAAGHTKVTLKLKRDLFKEFPYKIVSLNYI
jgi:hypothetical protein